MPCCRGSQFLSTQVGAVSTWHLADCQTLSQFDEIECWKKCGDAWRCGHAACIPALRSRRVEPSQRELRQRENRGQLSFQMNISENGFEASALGQGCLLTWWFSGQGEEGKPVLFLWPSCPDCSAAGGGGLCWSSQEWHPGWENTAIVFTSRALSVGTVLYTKECLVVGWVSGFSHFRLLSLPRILEDQFLCTPE